VLAAEGDQEDVSSAEAQNTERERRGHERKKESLLPVSGQRRIRRKPDAKGKSSSGGGGIFERGDGSGSGGISEPPKSDPRRNYSDV